MYITKEDRVFFSVEIEKVLNSIHVSGTGLELMPKLNPGKSVVRFEFFACNQLTIDGHKLQEKRALQG